MGICGARSHSTTSATTTTNGILIRAVKHVVEHSFGHSAHFHREPNPMPFQIFRDQIYDNTGYSGRMGLPSELAG